MTISTKTAFAWAALVAGVVFGKPAAAAEGGLYLATSYGTALSTYERSDIDRNLNAALNGRATVDTSESDDNKPIWSAGVGYLFSPNFGIEASYLDLGKLKYRSQGSGDPADIGTFSLDSETKSRGPALALVGSLPMGNTWGLDGRVGAYRVKSTSLLLGIGASLTVSTHVAVRLDYLYIDKIKEQALGGHFNVQLVTAGLMYVF